MNVETDLVDQICFEQRLRQHSTTKHADVFAFLCFQSLHIVCSIVVDERYFLVASFFDRAREDVSLDTWTTAPVAAHLKRNFVRATAHHDSVDVLPVVFHDLL